MTAQNPTLREDLNSGQAMRIADVLRTMDAGDLLAALIQNHLMSGRIQMKQVTLAGTPEAVTFETLDMVPPATTGYGVIVQGETVAVTTVDESTKTLLGFSILGGAAAEVVTVMVTEDEIEPIDTLAVAASAATIPRATDVVLEVFAVEAGATGLGRKTLLIGDASITPAPGQVVWDGATGLRFNATDAVTSIRIISLPSGTPLTAAILERILGQRDVG